MCVYSQHVANMYSIPSEGIYIYLLDLTPSIIVSQSVCLAFPTHISYSTVSSGIWRTTCLRMLQPMSEPLTFYAHIWQGPLKM